MMQVVLPRSWKEEFALAAAMRREDVLHKEKMARFEAASRQRIEEARIQQKRREQEFAALEAAFAPPARIAQFKSQLDTYDAKTVEALMDNQKAIEIVRQKIDGMLGKAQVLPDGRRVFKTTDGQKVYDEHGLELSRDVVDPAGIDDRKPRWEPYRDAKAEHEQLMQERQELHDYQTKLDDARARIDKGEITQKDLDTLKADIETNAPDAVREKLGLEKPKPDAQPKTTAPASSLPGDMDALMQKTGHVPAPLPGPG